jgi:ribosomal protein S18 acetylase RimI-like enzyme
VPAALSYQTATVDDADALASLRVAAMRASLERVGRFDLERARERFLSNFTPALTQWIVQDTTRVGFLVVERQADGLHLLHLYIHPSHQGQGVGAQVVQALCAEADAAQQSIDLAALRGSDANRFYQRHGFVVYGESEFDIFYLRRPLPRLS